MQVTIVVSTLARRLRAEAGPLSFVVVALAATLLTSTVEATPVAFTLTSTASTLDLTAKYTPSSTTAAVSIVEQSPGSKANRYSSPTTGSILTNLYPTGIDFPGGSVARGANQLGGIFGTTPVNLRPGVGGGGAAAPGNYGIAIAYPITPIVLPAIPLGSFGSVSPGSITGVELDVALRNIDLDFVATPTFHPATLPANFDASDVGVKFANGQADISVGAILNIAGITGLGTLADSLVRSTVASALNTYIASLLPVDSGIVVTCYNGTGSTEIVIATGLSQDLTSLGVLPNTPSTPGVLAKAGSNYNLTLPMSIDMAALIPENPIVSASDLSLNLSGKMFATAPYVTAVPEPSTLALAGAGLLSFVGYAVRRRRSAN